MATEQRERDVIVTPASESSSAAGMGIVLAVLVMLALGAIMYFWASGNQPPTTNTHTQIERDTVIMPKGDAPLAPPTVPGDAPSVTPPSVPGEAPSSAPLMPEPSTSK